MESRTRKELTVEEILNAICDMLESCAQKIQDGEFEMDAATALRVVSSDIKVLI